MAAVNDGSHFVFGVFGLVASYPLLLGRLTSKLADVLVVALSLPHSKQWEACWRYVMGVVDLAVVPMGRGSSPAEEPGSSLDVAGRTDTEQGNWASASAEAASAIHPARAAQDTQQHTATQPRRINRYLRPQLVEEMVALHQAGQTVAQIATRFGFHRTTVARHLKQAGETLRTDPADPAFQERVRQAYAELGTVKHTAQRLGVSKDTVRKVVRGE
ncbi:helix-turn-helix domain-containing protein [Actinomyces oris]|uniref:helix-turn-helix domain-containing protein n=1 Tax=Actinomyces oris TaxID=544580 RepID=UPI002852893F|nr:helix-turn-helix domain-containing protein [Actinomyces oris]